MNKSFDYIVCGGGTTGCVVAARLAEWPGVTVLLIEAGQHNQDLENFHMVGGRNALFGGASDWNIESQQVPSLNNRRLKLSRGKFLGGSSGLNGTLCIRGSQQDYDNWGLEGWSGEEVFKYMMKAETFHPKPWFDAELTDHGFSGPLDTEPHELAPISNLIMESFKSQGFDYDADMFTHGRNPHGYGHIPRSHWQGSRSTSADYIARKERSNLTVITGYTVERVLLEQRESALHATAVQVVGGDLSVTRFTANREIILSAGSYCSPAILLRSGIGARGELEQAGISCQVDLPGVGKNLLDHLIVSIFYETDHEYLTMDRLIHQKDGYYIALQQWKEEKNGFLSSSPFGIGAFARLGDRLTMVPEWTNAYREYGKDPMGLTPEQPNVEFFTTECFGGLKFGSFPEGKHAFGIAAALFSPRSHGSVTIKSPNALDLPLVDHNYLANPLDLLVLAEACLYANEIITSGKGTAGIVKGSWPPEASHHTYVTRDAWVDYVRDNAESGLHAAGTCKMGKPEDPMAVLDHKLRVRGVRNLRVADCSVMPTLNGGHTQMPAYGIGEKAADIIKEAMIIETETAALKGA